MKVSYEWLKSMVELPEDPSELACEFIRTGTEVESIDTVGEAYHKIVTAKVVVISVAAFLACGSFTGIVFRSIIYIVLSIKKTSRKNIISIIGIIISGGVFLLRTSRSFMIFLSLFQPPAAR